MVAFSGGYAVLLNTVLLNSSKIGDLAMRLPLKLALGLVLLVHPATADEAIDLEPFKPTSNVPLRLILTGINSGCGEPRAFHSLTIENAMLRVESIVAVGPCGLAPPSPPYAFTVDAGLLSPGLYTVEHVGIELGTDNEQIIATRDFFVDSGVAVEVVPNRPTSLDTIVLRLTGSGSCPPGRIGAVELTGAGEVRVSWDQGPCPTAISPPPVFTAESEPFGPLPAGIYDVVVRSLQGFERPLGTARFRVYPDPVTVRDRFEIEVTWMDFAGLEGRGQLVSPPSEDSALFWFFHPDNWELMVKVLDACQLNNHFWVFAAASTDVEYAIRVRDLEADREWSFANPLGAASPAVTDTAAFVCP